MSARVRLVTLVMALAGSGVPAGQGRDPQAPEPPPGPTFRAQVEYVEVDAVVADQQGNLVGDLKKEDFAVFEDGKPQPVSAFAVVDVPMERADCLPFAERAREADVQSNERPFGGRLYVMILDDLHVESMRSQRVKQSAQLFIERNLGANDLMAVLFTGHSADAQEFTGNKRLLLNAVDKFMGRKLQSATLVRNELYKNDRSIADSARAQGAVTAMPRVADPYDAERAQNDQNLLTTLSKAAEWFGGVHGRRKALLLFSEGVDYDLSDLIRAPRAEPSRAVAILSDIRDTIATTARANVSIYGVDARGLADIGDDTIGVSNFADQGDPGSGIGLASMRKELRQSQDSLRWLSDESGGFAAVNVNDTATVFDRIMRDNSSYYVLAYYPPTTKPDGKFHSIEVKVSRPGLVVRSRRGYAAPRGKPATKNTKASSLPPDILDAINSPLQVSGLHMRVFAAPFKGTRPNASVVVGVELSGRDLSVGANSKVEISLVAVDATSKVFGPLNDALTLNLGPESQARVEQGGVRVMHRIELPVGRYRLRIAARDLQKNVVGSIIYDLEVPDFYKPPIGMSGLAITSLAGAAMMTARPDERLKVVLPSPPIGTRVFEQNDELAVFEEIYDNSGPAPHRVDIVTSVLSEDGATVFTNGDSHDSSELSASKGGYDFTARVPLSGLAPGTYLLSVEARSSLGKDTSASRQIPFRVVLAGSGTQP